MTTPVTVTANANAQNPSVAKDIKEYDIAHGPCGGASGVAWRATQACHAWLWCTEIPNSNGTSGTVTAVNSQRLPLRRDRVASDCSIIA